MRVVAIIQARLTSKRLPKKILKKIGNKTILQHTIDGVKQSKAIDKLIVASPHKLPLPRGIYSFIGSEENVLERFYLCAKKYKADIIVRITADCPLIDSWWIDFCLKVLPWGGYSYVTNRPYCPDGLDVEVFTFDSLEQAYRKARKPYDLEHVTPYIRRNFKMAEISGIINKEKLSVDTQSDLDRVRRLYGV